MKNYFHFFCDFFTSFCTPSFSHFSFFFATFFFHNFEKIVIFYEFLYSSSIFAISFFFPYVCRYSCYFRIFFLIFSSWFSRWFFRNFFHNLFLIDYWLFPFEKLFWFWICFLCSQFRQKYSLQTVQWLIVKQVVTTEERMMLRRKAKRKVENQLVSAEKVCSSSKGSK